MKRLIFKLDIQDEELDSFASRVHAAYGSATIANMERFLRQAIKTDSAKILKNDSKSDSSSS